MKVLYVIKREIDDTARSLIDQHSKDAEVAIIDLNVNKDYAEIVRQTFASDQVICW